MEVKATVQLTAKQMFEFLMHHTYSSMNGIIGGILSILGYAGFVYMLFVPDVSEVYLVALLFIGLLFTVIQPLMIYSRSKRQVKTNESINKPFEYVISQRGVDISQDGQKGFTPWEEIIKITSSRNNIMFYTSRVHAYVFPKQEIGQKMEELKTLVRENSTARYIKIK